MPKANGKFSNIIYEKRLVKDGEEEDWEKISLVQEMPKFIEK